MRWILPFLLAGLPAFAAPKTKMAAEAPPETRPPFVLGLRGGFLLKTPDRAVLGRWEHQPLESYQVALSGFYSFPQAWKQVYFFAGPEFYYQSSVENLSAQTYTSSIDISIYQFMLTGGVAYRPYWAGGNWGVSFATAFEVWGQKTAALDTQGYTQNLGTESTRDSGGFLPISLNAVLAFYYDFGAIRPQLVIESNSSIGLGVAYAF